MGRRVLLPARLVSLVAGLAASLTAATAPAAALDPVSKPELIAFPSGELELKGFIWKPAGAGPFPPSSGITEAKRNQEPLMPLPRFSWRAAMSSLCPTGVAKGGRRVPTSWTN